MRIDVLTLFPEMLRGPFDASIVARGREAGALEIAVHDIRDYAEDRHRIVDDYAYGGGPGMVMKPEPLFACVEAVRTIAQAPGKVVLLTPQGRLLTQAVVAELSREARIIVICGHYEGVDERVRQALADDEISVGDYVLSGGEPAVIVLVDAIARCVPGVLGSEQSLTEESHAQGLLEYPQYTRPAEYRGMAVPDILLSGNHADITRWRRRQSIARTARRRPDMLASAQLTPGERRWLQDELAGAAPGTTRTQLFRVAMPVPDLERATAFYAALLGGGGVRVSETRHDFNCGGTILEVVDVARPGEEFRPNAEHVYFAVPDLRERFYAARRAGCAYIDEKIERQSWGEKSFYARDPFGNPICFVDERTVFTGKEPR